LSAGWGAEIDVHGTRKDSLYVGHDRPEFLLPLPVSKEESKSVFLHLKDVSQANLGPNLHRILHVQGWLDSAYVFCNLREEQTEIFYKQLPSSVRCLAVVESLAGLNRLLMEQPSTLDAIHGVWLEQPEADWVDVHVVDAVHKVGKTAWVVSSELHDRVLDLAATQQWGTADGICTDYPHLLERVLDTADAHMFPTDPWWT
jgi:hypothetical protein